MAVKKINEGFDEKNQDKDWYWDKIAEFRDNSNLHKLLSGESLKKLFVVFNVPYYREVGNNGNLDDVRDLYFQLKHIVRQNYNAMSEPGDMLLEGYDLADLIYTFNFEINLR